MLKNCADIAKLKKISRQAVQKFITKNKISPSGKKGKLPLYDCDAEPLASYLSAARKPLPESTNVNKQAPPSVGASAKKSKTKKYEMPLNDILAAKMGESGKLSATFYSEALEMARENKDAMLIFKLAMAADKEAKDEIIREQMRLTEEAKQQIAQARAEKLKIENDIQQGEYIRLEKVKILYGRICAVHTSILTPLSLKLSSMIAAVPEGSTKESTIRKLIDDEIYAALGSIKTLLVDFINE